MERRVDLIEKAVVADTCAVWNLLSSVKLHGACVATGFVFAVTDYVLYECLAKPPSKATHHHELLRSRLRQAQKLGQFESVALSVDDLQDVAQLEARRHVSKGELSGIAVARRTGIGFQTDDRAARRLAAEMMDALKVQTTPHVLGWLFFNGTLVDGDLADILAQHAECKRPLQVFFQQMYEEAMRCRLLGRREKARGA